MTDPNDTELIRRVHTRSCADPGYPSSADAPLSPQAEERCREIQNVWLALGTWELPQRKRDLWPRIEQAAREESTSRHGRLSRWLRRVLDSLASVLPGRRRRS